VGNITEVKKAIEFDVDVNKTEALTFCNFKGDLFKKYYNFTSDFKVLKNGRENIEIIVDILLNAGIFIDQQEAGMAQTALILGELISFF
jgi:hypothetical protein